MSQSMTTDQGMITDVVARLDPETVSRAGAPAELVRRYLEHQHSDDLDDIGADNLAAIINAHVRLGAHRAADTDSVVADTPDPSDTWRLSGSTLLQIITDDRPFLVDSVTMEITRQDWTIRHLFHPQLRIARHADGELVPDGAGETIAESWTTFVVYPPLGVAADERADQLVRGVSEVLAEVRLVTDDWTAMRTQLSEAVDLLGTSAYDSRPDDRDSARDLMRWLRDDNVTLLGYRTYSYDGIRYEPVPGSGLGVLRTADDPFDALPTPGENGVLVFTKDSVRSRVHRGGYRDYVGVRMLDETGAICGERRFVGVLSAPAYTEPVTRIPILVAKAVEILRRSGYSSTGHGYKALLETLNTYPRDALFHASVDELYPIVERIATLGERRQVRLFCHRDPWHRFVNCLVYLPRDRYTTEVTERIKEILGERLGGVAVEHSALVTESVVARLDVVVRLAEGANSDVDLADVEDELTEATRTWDEHFIDRVYEWPSERRGVDFPDSYKEVFTPQQGVDDLGMLNALTGGDEMRAAILDPGAGDAADMRLRLYRRTRIALPDVLPHLDDLGVSVIDEWPFEVSLRGEPVWLYEFGLRTDGRRWDAADRERFIDAFQASITGRLEVGPMNALVTTAGMTWAEVGRLRAMERYLKQGGMTYSFAYIANALLALPKLSARLVAAFRTAHDPEQPGSAAEHRDAAEAQLVDIESELDQVSNLDQDRIIRAFVAFQRAAVRTNAFTDLGDRALAIKLLPGMLPMLPEPRPAYEIWVYSPRVEGVHLRFGRVARGGLRWSDRAEDFRTEVLGLVKAQMVKNTVIVPVGAKGGFVARHLPDPTVDRAAWMAEGQHAYRMFVTSLLSVTDTIVAGAVVGPERVVRHDDDDPYLVVAADKGTATFSDLANEISLARGFWLGDAFASGGTNGYDHKAMGITARGAWESVKRHFQDVGIDPQNDDVTCVGIGDMSGDVFGNGMLLSHHIKLVAAFDHRHVFIDPDPDPAASFAERDRLFALPRSSWADYDAAAISQGGGVYARTVKAIPVTAQARTALGLPDGVPSLSPAEYIHAILQAPVDLLWNGGIGTYVKATRETHADAGDRANDAVRVDATQVRARCAGEGGNLGWTQAARIEYSRAGGRINTDFIDNSAGVDTSDHEVNIKILLTDAETHGRLTEAERNELLPEMTGDVAALVLAHNVDQNQALAMARYQAARFSAIHEDWMRVLSDDGYLDRHLETMPSTSEMTRRIAAGEGLCSPELATLFAWTKIRLADIIVASDLPDDPYLADRLIQYFPKPLRERFGDLMGDHPLRREIITTVAVNRFVNSQGISSYHRLSSDTGASAADIIRAQLASRSIFRVGALEVGLRRESLDAETYVELMVAMRHLVERGTRWVLQTLGTPINVAKAVETFAGPSREVLDNLEHVATPSVVESWTWRRDGLVEQGLSPDLARLLAAEPVAHLAPAIVLIASRASHDLLDTARRFFEIRDRLELGRFFDAAEALPRTDRWSLMAQAAIVDELLGVQAALGAEAVTGAFDGTRPDLERIAPLLADLALEGADLGRLSVAVRLLRSLVKG
jgi:glutamate dehydrogenase